MSISLENWIRNKLQANEEMQDYAVATDTVRCWIDEYKQLSQQPVSLPLPPCTCDVYTKKEMTAPDCVRCKYEAKIKEVIEDESVSVIQIYVYEGP